MYSKNAFRIEKRKPLGPPAHNIHCVYLNERKIGTMPIVEDDDKEPHLITEKAKYVNMTSVCTRKTYLE